MAEPSSLQNILGGLQALTPGDKSITTGATTDTQTSEDTGKTTKTTGTTTTGPRTDTSQQTTMTSGRSDISGSTTTVGPRHDVQQLMLTDADVDLLVQHVLESTQGLASITGASHAAGIYGDTTAAQLSSNLIARAAAEAAAKRAPLVTDIGAQTTTTSGYSQIGGTSTTTLGTSAIGAQTSTQNQTSITDPTKQTTTINRGATTQNIKTSAAITPDILKKASVLGLSAAALQKLMSGDTLGMATNTLSKVKNYLFGESSPAGVTSISGLGDSLGLLGSDAAGVNLGAGLDVSNILSGIGTGAGAVEGAEGLGSTLGLLEGTTDLSTGLGASDLLGGLASPVFEGAGEGVAGIVGEGASDLLGLGTDLLGEAMPWVGAAQLAGKVLGIKEIDQAVSGVSNLVGDVVSGVGHAVSGVWHAVTGGCYITTAVCDFQGKPDDCDELQTLREFRDGYMSNMDSRAALIQQYYNNAPIMVEKFNLLPYKQQEHIASELYHGYIVPAVAYIKRGQNEVALGIYSAMYNYMNAAVKGN